MKQITEDDFQEVIEKEPEYKVLITSPTCDKCHEYVESHKFSNSKYVIYEGMNDKVSNFLSENGVSDVPVFVIKTELGIFLKEPDA